MTDYKLTRSSRKTVELCVRDGIVEVKAPLLTPKTEIDKCVASKEDWIVKRLGKHKELTEKRRAFSLNYGDKTLYRGKEYPIVARSGNRVGFDDNALCFYTPTNLPPKSVKAAVIQVYKRLAKRHLAERVLHYQQMMGVAVINLKINSAKTHWGSMSGKKSVNFSWRLILADDDIIDAVVVHELAHIKQMNHSDKFKAEIERIIPDWREREKRLKEFSRIINTQNWEVDWEAVSKEPEPIVPVRKPSAQKTENQQHEQLTLFD
ncbi:MAG: SprT family zinc-dependent metalloprotease [Eubacteriales bacterium]|nr:SprT family zinc-dependent metalloprotease [Eubacteriales bacterium]